MSTFKDLVASDIDKVFLNADEFAEVHDINGVDILAVVSNNLTQQQSRVLGGPRSTDGLHGEYAMIAAKTSDLPYVPVQGQNFKLDGRLYKVESCVIDMGMVNITLAAYRMGGTVL